MCTFGNLADAFSALRAIAEKGKHGEDLRQWAESLADHLGESENFLHSWPQQYQTYYTIDSPHRTVLLREKSVRNTNGYDVTMYVDKDGNRHEHWMVKPLEVIR